MTVIEHDISTLTRHGGDLQNAIERYGGSPDQWLDLSTGISPWGYPIPAFDTSTWHKLPPCEEALIAAASSYYQCKMSEITVTPGSQLAIRLIPQIVKQNTFDKSHSRVLQTVAIPAIGYQEHAKSWQMAGHWVVRYQDYTELLELINSQTIGHVVVINPNNPTGETINTELLIQLSAKIKGILLLDEAFADIDEQFCVSNVLSSLPKNVVILKSIGKFFGLAGARIGFAIGRHCLITKLGQLLSPWSIAAPSIEVATLALNDKQWQIMQRLRIMRCAEKQAIEIERLASTMLNSRCINQGLFFTIFAQNDSIKCVHKRLAEHKVWSRLGDPFEDQHKQQLNWLRLSLAGDHLDRFSKVRTLISTITTKQHHTHYD